jgi:hypothetical protein
MVEEVMVNLGPPVDCQSDLTYESFLRHRHMVSIRMVFVKILVWMEGNRCNILTPSWIRTTAWSLLD